MKKIITGIALIFCSLPLISVAQTDTTMREPVNSAQKIVENDNKISFGAYGQLDYNQPLDSDFRKNGMMDIHRLVLFFGYNFSPRVSFVSEIEIEHVVELYVEQAFMNYRLNDYISLRGGLLLIPMGIMNEYHEPTTFNGVERPNLDSRIVPTTWREMGAGIFGKVNSVALKYQLYVVNGFNGYDGEAKFRGNSGFRSGRQKGAESYISSPDISGKVDYYGINGLKLGLAGYVGRSESLLYDDLDPNDPVAVATADSSSVGIKMLGFDARYNFKGLEARGQVIYAGIDNANEYNHFTGSDLGSTMFGWYGELGFDVFSLVNSIDKKLVVFSRYEQHFTHYEVPADISKNLKYNRTDITTGISFFPSPNSVVKADYQIFKDETGADSRNQVNVGIGFWFY